MLNADWKLWKPDNFKIISQCCKQVLPYFKVCYIVSLSKTIFVVFFSGTRLVKKDSEQLHLVTTEVLMVSSLFMTWQIRWEHNVLYCQHDKPFVPWKSDQEGQNTNLYTGSGLVVKCQPGELKVWGLFSRCVSHTHLCAFTLLYKCKNLVHNVKTSFHLTSLTKATVSGTE